MLTRRAPLVAALAVAALGCKTDREPPPARTARPSEVPAPSPAPSPAARDAAPLPVEERGFDRARLEAIAPELSGATPLTPLVFLEEREQAHQSFCLPESDAAAAAQRLAADLERGGWTDVTSRGTAERAGTSATRGDLQLSISFGGRDPACSGLVATAHYRSDTILLPPLAPGERIR